MIIIPFVRSVMVDLMCPRSRQSQSRPKIKRAKMRRSDQMNEGMTRLNVYDQVLRHHSIGGGEENERKTREENAKAGEASRRPSSEFPLHRPSSSAQHQRRLSTPGLLRPKTIDPIHRNLSTAPASASSLNACASGPRPLFHYRFSSSGGCVHRMLD